MLYSLSKCRVLHCFLYHSGEKVKTDKLENNRVNTDMKSWKNLYTSSICPLRIDKKRQVYHMLLGITSLLMINEITAQTALKEGL